jgi:hypothetical protein
VTPRLQLMTAGALLGVAYGCVAGTGEGSSTGSSAAPQETIRLRVGESAFAGHRTLALGFEAVTADSRCAKGVVCIWEGDATVRLWLQHGSDAREVRELHTSTRAPDAADYAGWNIHLLRLDPAPVAERSIAQGDYIATLQVSHGGATTGAVN